MPVVYGELRRIARAYLARERKDHTLQTTGLVHALDPRQGRLVELRFFGGLSIGEAAVVLQPSPATVSREWSIAKAWLYKEMGGSAA